MKKKIIQYAVQLILTVGILIGIVVGIKSCIDWTKNDCPHEEKFRHYSLNDIPEYSTIQFSCKKCNKSLGHSTFQGIPTDKPYLDLLREHCGVEELIGGEYYTITATITLSYYYGEVQVMCKIQNEDIAISFAAKFKDEFKDSVSYSKLDEGSTIMFRGQFVYPCCDWLDCELLN